LYFNYRFWSKIRTIYELTHLTTRFTTPCHRICAHICADDLSLALKIKEIKDANIIGDCNIIEDERINLALANHMKTNTARSFNSMKS
jgi:hypothetical protein